MNYKLQIIYLGVSLISTTSYITNLYMGACGTFIGVVCLFDLYLKYYNKIKY